VICLRFKQHAFAGLVLIKGIGSGAGFRVLSAVEMGVHFLFHIKRSMLPTPTCLGLKCLVVIVVVDKEKSVHIIQKS
jgi:hypothetical protein